MELKFSSIEEVQEFVKRLKGTRGGKDKDDGETVQHAPQPLQPPAGGAVQGFPGGASGFVPPAGGATQAGGAFPVAAAPTVAPEVQALVTRIVTRLDQGLASGATKEADATAWFRSNCGPEAANADLNQIKAVYLARLPVPTLEGIAKMMAA